MAITNQRTDLAEARKALRVALQARRRELLEELADIERELKTFGISVGTTAAAEPGAEPQRRARMPRVSPNDNPTNEQIYPVIVAMFEGDYSKRIKLPVIQRELMRHGIGFKGHNPDDALRYRMMRMRGNPFICIRSVGMGLNPAVDHRTTVHAGYGVVREGLPIAAEAEGK